MQHEGRSFFGQSTAVRHFFFESGQIHQPSAGCPPASCRIAVFFMPDRSKSSSLFHEKPPSGAPESPCVAFLCQTHRGVLYKKFQSTLIFDR
jgi:hypothetical protein